MAKIGSAENVVCDYRKFTDGVYDSDNQLSSEPADERSVISVDAKDSDKKQMSSPRARATPTTPGDASAIDRDRVYCPPSDIFQPNTTSSMLSQQHIQQQFLSCWLNQVSPTTLTNGQTRHSL